MTRGRWIVGFSIFAGLALLALANANLVYVAFASQPQCLRHLKAGEGNATKNAFSAAQSSC